MKLFERLELESVSHTVPHGEAWLGREGSKSLLVMLPKEGAPAEMVDRLRELATLGAAQKLRSPYLAPLTHAAIAEDGRPFVALAPLDAPLLSARMVDGELLTIESAGKLMGDVLSGLAALEKLGLAHGDVDPRHLHLVEQRQGLGVRLAGLGLNRAAMRSGAAPAPSEDEAVEALRYAAPEQARGEVLASSAADVYSAMAIFYAIVSGRPPFLAGSAAALRAAVSKGAPTSLGTVREELAGPFAELVDRALASDPAARFKTIEELQRAMRAAVLRVPFARTLATVHVTLSAAAVSPAAVSSPVASSADGAAPTTPTAASSAVPAGEAGDAAGAPAAEGAAAEGAANDGAARGEEAAAPASAAAPEKSKPAKEAAPAKQTPAKEAKASPAKETRPDPARGASTPAAREAAKPVARPAAEEPASSGDGLAIGAAVLVIIALIVIYFLTR